MQKNTRILGVTLASVLMLGGVVALVLKTFAEVPDFTGLKTSVEIPIRFADGSKATRSVGPRARGWVNLNSISNAIILAVLASEDSSFFIHKGVDFHELREALKKDIKEKRWARGASTITQQVIKNVYLDAEKTLWRKLKEIIWASELEKVLTKPQILCFYLNMAEWGPGIYGINQAALHYFRILPSELTFKQSAFLAMLLPSPVKYHVYFEKKELSSWALRRVNQILKVMLRLQYIDEATYQQALRESLWGERVESLGGEEGEEGEEVSPEEQLPDKEFPPESVAPPPEDSQDLGPGTELVPLPSPDPTEL